MSLAVNWHMLSACNYRCVFCFARRLPGKPLCYDVERSRLLLESLATSGVRRINFTGGEPLLCPTLGELIAIAAELGMATSIVTNGYYLAEERGTLFLRRYGGYIDWIGMSLDSGREDVEAALGRGYGDHVKRVIAAAEKIRRIAGHIGVKINTVVTKLNYREDMHPVLEKIRPERWKVFQLKIVRGINTAATALAPTYEEYMYFVTQHLDLDPVYETSTDMTNTYIMIDQNGNLYDETSGGYRTIGSPIEKPLTTLLEESGFDLQRYIKRGAIYGWYRRMPRQKLVRHA